jgi:hypothetical protein
VLMAGCEARRVDRQIPRFLYEGVPSPSLLMNSPHLSVSIF